MANVFIRTTQKNFLIGLVALMFFGVFAQSVHALSQPEDAGLDGKRPYSSGGYANGGLKDAGTVRGGDQDAYQTYSNSSGASKTTSDLKTMIESLQKRVEALTKLVQQKNTVKKSGDAAARATGDAPERVTRNLGIGSKGEQVTNLQQCLVDLGYFNQADMDPTYGPKTRQAVKAFQAAEGIANSGNEWSTGYGYVGPKTRKKLNNECGNGSAAASAVANTRSTKSGKECLVDLVVEKGMVVCNDPAPAYIPPSRDGGSYLKPTWCDGQVYTNNALTPPKSYCYPEADIVNTDELVTTDVTAKEQLKINVKNKTGKSPLATKVSLTCPMGRICLIRADWGDGTVEDQDNSSVLNPTPLPVKLNYSHTYKNPGTYEVKLFSILPIREIYTQKIKVTE